MALERQGNRGRHWKVGDGLKEALRGLGIGRWDWECRGYVEGGIGEVGDR